MQGPRYPVAGPTGDGLRERTNDSAIQIGRAILPTRQRASASACSPSPWPSTMKRSRSWVLTHRCWWLTFVEGSQPPPFSHL